MIILRQKEYSLSKIISKSRARTKILEEELKKIEGRKLSLKEKQLFNRIRKNHNIPVNVSKASKESFYNNGIVTINTKTPEVLSHEFGHAITQKGKGVKYTKALDNLESEQAIKLVINRNSTKNPKLSALKLALEKGYYNTSKLIDEAKASKKGISILKEAKAEKENLNVAKRYYKTALKAHKESALQDTLSPFSDYKQFKPKKH